MPLNENYNNEMHSFNHLVSSSTPKPTNTPPPLPPQQSLTTGMFADNIYFNSQPNKYAFHSPANNCYYPNPASLVSPQYLSASTPVNYYNNNNGYNDINCHYPQYNTQIDSYNNSYCQISNNSPLVDSNYYSKSSSSLYDSNRNTYFTDSAYESPIANSSNMGHKTNKLFTIDSILNDGKINCEKKNNNNNKENVIPNLDSTNNDDDYNEDLSQDNLMCNELKSNGKITKKNTRVNSKRVRTIFTQDQLDKLEVEFMKQQYMVGSERYYLANELNLNEAQVKIWFQNRRIKWRKENVEQKRSNCNSNQQLTTPQSPNESNSLLNE